MWWSNKPPWWKENQLKLTPYIPESWWWWLWYTTKVRVEWWKTNSRALDTVTKWSCTCWFCQYCKERKNREKK